MHGLSFGYAKLSVLLRGARGYLVGAGKCLQANTGITMAYVASSRPVIFSLGKTFAAVCAAVTGLGRGIMRAVELNSVAQLRLEQVRRHQEMSDAELAGKGLRREDLVQHFFADLF